MLAGNGYFKTIFDDCGSGGGKRRLKISRCRSCDISIIKVYASHFSEDVGASLNLVLM